MLFNNIDVNSQILYAAVKWDEMEKADSTKIIKKNPKHLNDVKHACEDKLRGVNEVKILFSRHIYSPAVVNLLQSF